MRDTFRGSAASAARAFVIASVSGRERYSTPEGDVYWTEVAPVWSPLSVGTSAGPSVIAAPRRKEREARIMGAILARKTSPAAPIPDLAPC